MSAIGLALTYPALFNRQSAAKFQRILYSLFPSIVRFQEQVQLRAARQGYLGGSDHPFRYKHWFWNVYTWNPRKRAWELGDDAKKAVAYYPQSTSAGIIKESALRLMEDPEFATCYKGKTPIRAWIHDSILVELPDPGYEKYLSKMKQVMTRSIPEQPMNPDWNMGTHLKIGVAIKVGKSWADMKEIKI